MSLSWKILKRLRTDQWFWVLAKAVLFVWGLVYLFYPSYLALHILGRTINVFISIFAMTGAVFSVLGLIMSLSREVDTRHRGLVIEIFGLTIAAASPATYGVTQLFLLPEESVRISSPFFSFALAAFIAGRIFTVRRGLRKVSL